MAGNSYNECSHIQKKEMVHVPDENIVREIGLNYRTIPTFEKGLSEQLFIRHNSLKRNNLLSCRWKEYKKHYEERVFVPFQFPDHRDLHFYKGTVRFEPSQSVFRITDHRRKLKPGPGVDMRGQMPIPQEAHMKRGNVETETVTVKDRRLKMKSAERKPKLQK